VSAPGAASVISGDADEYEFCQWEMFTAECRRDNHVLLVRSAHYACGSSMGKLFTPRDRVLLVRSAHYACFSSMGQLFTPRDRVLLVRAAHYSLLLVHGQTVYTT